MDGAPRAGELTSARRAEHGGHPPRHDAERLGERDVVLGKVDVRLDDLARPSFTLLDEGSAEQVPVSLQLSGEHHVSNALAAAAVGIVVGMPLEQIGDALGSERLVDISEVAIHKLEEKAHQLDLKYHCLPFPVIAVLFHLHHLEAL